MRIALTGATGFLGSHVRRALTGEGHELRLGNTWLGFTYRPT
jgi:uncharacterized protein YbjT (DUF2867 family)